MVPASGNGEQAGASGFPDYRSNVALSNVKAGYTLLCKHAVTLVFVPGAAMLLFQLWRALNSGALYVLYLDASQQELKLDLITVIVLTCLLSTIVVAFFLFRTQPIYLVNFSAYKPHPGAKISCEYFKLITRKNKKFDAEAVEFQTRVIDKVGLGEETYLPPSLKAMPPAISMNNARLEAEMVLFGSVRDVLNKTGIKPEQIGVLVVNCCLFNPLPSLAAMVINHFKMRHDIVHFNLGGMGCSAGLIAIDLAARLLQVHSNTYALVVSTENMTQNWYFGNDRGMLLPNCLFRLGCSAVVMSNKRRERWRAKYQLQCPVVRTITGGQNDKAFRCIFQSNDEQGETGVKLSKELMGEAGRALKQNITTLGPLVLPFSEQLLFFVNLVLRKVFKAQMKSYIPDFTLAFNHICIHTGGRAVIEEIEKQLQLPEHMVKPTKETLFRYGNTSVSSIWYILANIETNQGVQTGENVWQIGFGSGFKCNSTVWRALRNNHEQHAAWTDEEMEVDDKWVTGATWGATDVIGASPSPTTSRQTGATC